MNNAIMITVFIYLCTYIFVFPKDTFLKRDFLGKRVSQVKYTCGLQGFCFFNPQVRGERTWKNITVFRLSGRKWHST